MKRSEVLWLSEPPTWASLFFIMNLCQHSLLMSMSTRVFFVALSKRLLKGVERSYGPKGMGCTTCASSSFEKMLPMFYFRQLALCLDGLAKLGRRFVTSPSTCCRSRYTFLNAA